MQETHTINEEQLRQAIAQYLYDQEITEITDITEIGIFRSRTL